MSTVNLQKNTVFRNWLNNKWFEHKDELYNWCRQFPEYDSKYYFRKHKWMLKKMFKDENRKEK